MSRDHTILRRRRFLALLGIGALAGCNSLGGDGTGTETPIPSPTGTPTATPSATQQSTGTTTEAPPYDVERNVMVEMRDGVSLATDVYLPSDAEGPFPTLVNRTPYNKAEGQPVAGTAPAVERGYAVVHQDVRGRFASEGEWVPFFGEGQDGYDTVEWSAEQDWSTGDIGMYGNSYMGATTWLAILEDPPSLVAAAPLITPGNLYAHLIYSGGAYNLGSLMFWTAFTSLSHVPRMDVSEDEAERLQSELRQLLENFSEGMTYLPTIDHPAFDEGVAPYWQDWNERSTYDEYWREVDVLQGIEDVSVPVVHAVGWYDTTLKGQTSLYEAIEDRGTDVVRENQHMVVGPWTHATFGTAAPVGDRTFGDNAAFDMGGDLIFPWFDRWLGGGSGLDAPPVQYYQMGDDEWRTSEQWPPSGVQPTAYYFDSDGSANGRSGDGVLTTNRPGADVPVDNFTYDPFDPVPTNGGPLLMGQNQPGGVADQSSIEEREDVLVYTSPELSEDVAIAGDVEATLFAMSTAPDTDFVVRLVDIEPDGYAGNVSGGNLRVRYRNSFEDSEFMDPGTVYELSVELRDVAHTFAAGHRIRVDVTSSNFPKIDRNPNSAIPVAEATEDDMTTATNTLYHDADRPSRIELPVM